MTSPLAPRRVTRMAALIATLTVVGLVATACGSDHTTSGTTQVITKTAGGSGSASGSSSASSSAKASPAKPKPKPVHVSLKFGDGQVLGVGIPIIAFLSRPIADARGFAAATRVTVNGRRVQGAWYFERKYGDAGHPVEADYRLPVYWPAHSSIHLSLPVKGVSAGAGLAFANSLTLDFATGVSRIVTVDDAAHRLTVVADGRTWGSFPVSLGAANTRTRRGTKVIMEKGRSICMSGPGYHECGVKYTQRLTYDGEYLHSAPWNCVGSPGCVGPQNNIGRADSSNGCTNLHPADAAKLYQFLDVGDVVKYPNANGQLMQIGDGYGDWNVPWPQWRLGGLYRTT
ncbi:MAG: L,D-transpeptidase [Jatrophihabitantaceae bacterium]